MAEKKRITILLSVLLIFIFGYIFKIYYLDMHKSILFLSGKNQIKSIVINKENSKYFATVTYFYNGSPNQGRIVIIPTESKSFNELDISSFASAVPGHNTIKMEINRPLLSNSVLTKYVIVSMGYPITDAAVTKDYKIEWPNLQQYRDDKEFGNKSSDVLVTDAIKAIDTSDNYDYEYQQRSLKHARRILERVILKDTKYVDAYPQLARIAMKQNWSKDGLSQAEQYIKTALSLKADHVESHVLLGYIYTNQNRLNEAESEFELAEKLGTDNLWLWSNWGDLFVRKNNEAKAIAKYEKAIAFPPSSNSYDRARLESYRHLIDIHYANKNYTKIEFLYNQREADYPAKPCFYSDHAEFQIYQNFNNESTANLAKMAIDKGCNFHEAKNVLGLAYYLNWLHSTNADELKFISLARSFFPESAELYAALARSENTFEVLKKLNPKTNLDVKNNHQLTALSLSLVNDDIPSAQRLIAFGANPNLTVGEKGFPIAFIPVFKQSETGVNLILRSSANLNRIRFDGDSIFEYAAKFPNKKIISLLNNKAKVSTL